VPTANDAFVAMDYSANLFMRYEEKTAFRKPKKKCIPTVLITGCLGAGKTTLVNHMLESKGDLRLAVAVNDFSEKNFDTEMLRKSGKATKMIDLSKGCICCSLSDGFKDAVWELLEESDRDLADVDYLVIESSGVTDPLLVASTLDERFGKMSRIRLDQVVCVVDAEWLGIAWGQGRARANKLLMSQIRSADVVLLNKTDLCPHATLSLAKQAVNEVAPGVHIIACCQGKVGLSTILEVELVGAGEGTVSHDPSEEVMYTVKGARERLRGKKNLMENCLSNGATHSSFTSCLFAPKKPVSFPAFQEHIRRTLPQGTRRIKGEISFAELPKARFIFQLSGNNRVDLMEEMGNEMLHPSTSLAYILDHDVSAIDLNKQMLRPVDYGEIQHLVGVMKDLLKKDPWFEVLEFPGTATAACDSLAFFRLIGIEGKEGEIYEFERLYGIDFNAMNMEYVALLNGCGDTHVFLPFQAKGVSSAGIPKTLQGLAWTPRISHEDLDRCLQRMREVAAIVCKRHLGHIRRCNCGF